MNHPRGIPPCFLCRCFFYVSGIECLLAFLGVAFFFERLPFGFRGKHEVALRQPLTHRRGVLAPAPLFIYIPYGQKSLGWACFFFKQNPLAFFQRSPVREVSESSQFPPSFLEFADDLFSELADAGF